MERIVTGRQAAAVIFVGGVAAVIDAGLGFAEYGPAIVAALLLILGLAYLDLRTDVTVPWFGTDR